MPSIEAADLRIHYRQWGPSEDPAGPILLVHGNWSTHRWWIPLAERADEAGLGQRRLIALDLRGRGDTQGPDHGYTIPELRADLLAFVDALGLARVHLVGHSLGSAVAMDFAREHGDRTASLVAVAPAWVDGMPDQWKRPEAQAAVQADRDHFARMLEPMAPTAPRDALWTELVETGHRQRPTATQRNLEALAAWAPGDSLSALAMPRAVVDGERDPLCGGETAARAAEALNDCERVTLAGVGHSPNLEAPVALGRIIARVCGPRSKTAR